MDIIILKYCIMDVSILIILVFMVSLAYTVSQSDIGSRSTARAFGYNESLTIISPNYPDNYPNYANTQWLVSGPPNYQLIAVFRTFHLEPGKFDTLKIGSGLNPSNVTSLLVTLSGSILPNDVISTSNEMWLVFTSDISVTDQGFEIDVSIFTHKNVSASTSLYGTDVNRTKTYYLGEDLNNSSSDMSEVLYAEKCFEESCSGETTVCRCDDMCQFFGDCCPDHPLLIFNEILTNVTWANETLANETAMQPTNLDTWECITDSFLPELHPDLNHGYRMISRCPSEWSSSGDVKHRCEDRHGNAASDVLYYHKDTYFRNLACAICHGLEESLLTAISISADEDCSWRGNNTLVCMAQPPISHHNISSNTNASDGTIHMADVRTVPKPRLCLDNTTDRSCPNGTNDEMARECQYYYKPYIIDSVLSKHPACSQCNGGPLVRCPMHMMPVFPVERVDQIQYEDVGIVDVFHIEPENNLLIPPLLCQEGFELVNYECVPLLSDWPICQFKHIWVTPTEGAEDCLEDMLCFRQVTIDNLTVIRPTPPPCLVRSSLPIDTVTMMTFSLVYGDDIDPSLETIENDIIRQVYAPNRNGHCENMIISAGKSCYVDDDSSNMTDHCPEEVFTGHLSDFTPSLINNESLVFSNGTYIRPRWWSNITDIDFSSVNVSSKYQFILCGTEVALQTCSLFVVSNDSVEWIEQENQSGILHQGQMYDIDNVLINPDGSFSICYIDQDTQSDGRALMILGHVLIAISSICLFATFITYLAFSPLRNRQGVSIMNFIIALILGQILLQYVRMSVSHVFIPCVIVAALSHFFFLASFVWTTIIAWDLSRSFAASKMKSFSSSSFGRKMVAFLLVGWGVPLMFVLITLVLQFGGFQNGPFLEYDIRTCWLAKLASIVMFFTPMTLCLLSNLVLFIITIHGVHSTKKSTSMLKEGQESQFKQWMVELRIYIKISALLGFAWLFGFLAMVINIPFMDYLFIIVIGLQGVFIFISFGANKRVRKLWRTSVENSTLWTTLSRREYSYTRGRTSTDTHDHGKDTK